LDAFVSGTPLVELANLRLAFWTWRLIPIIERVIEMRHSQVHKHIAGRHVSPSFVSGALRGEELERSLSDKDNFSIFAELFEIVRAPRDLIKELGLQYHPVLSEMLNMRKPTVTTSKLLAAAAGVMYSTDLTSKYEIYQEARAFRKVAKAKAKSAAQKWFKLAGKWVGPKLGTWAAIAQAACLDHFRQKFESDKLYSLETSLLSAGKFEQLRNALAPVPLAVAAPLEPLDVGPQLESDCDDRGAAAVQMVSHDPTWLSSTHVFFRVVSSLPSRSRTCLLSCSCRIATLVLSLAAFGCVVLMCFLLGPRRAAEGGIVVSIGEILK
jgi:hypothetical protein